jgi:phospholipid/cholesterol/gamma-HCH transport system substrate-binding protein
MSLRRAIERYARSAAIILAVMVVALVCAAYILSQQRLSSPFSDSYDVEAAFTNLTAVAPGLGEPVNVAGVKVGQISGVTLRDGQAIAKLRIDPGELEHVYADARATLIPNTPLKDMRIDLKPGTPQAGLLPQGKVIPSFRTTTPIDLDELLAAMDTDTRAFFTGLVADLDTGTRGRGRDLREILRSLGPTAEQLRQVSDLLAQRRHQLPKLVHDLSTLTRAAGGRDREIADLVRAGNATLGALAGQEPALRTALARLPHTLDLAGETLSHSTRLTSELRPTLDALMPAARRLPQTLRDTRLLFEGGALLPLRELRRFVAAAQPLTSSVPSAVEDLSAQTPPLTDAFRVLNYVVNELAYNPGSKNKSFLYWTAWFAHNANSVFSTQDAHGAVVRGLVMGSCQSLAQPGVAGDVLKLLLGSNSGCGS